LAAPSAPGGSEGIGFYRYDMTTGKGSNKPTVETPSGAYKVIAL